MLFKAQTWEEIKVIAAQDTSINEAAETIYQLSADERVRLECEAREDYWKRQRGLNRLLNKKDQIIAEKDQALAEKDQALAEKDNEIAKLKALLAAPK